MTKNHKRKKNLVGCPISKITNVVLSGFLYSEEKADCALLEL
jgi:hypothetical protein